MQLEINSIYVNGVWTLVDWPNGIHPIGYKGIYKRKRRIDGKNVTYKTRLVTKGDTQIKRDDYEKIFASVAMIKGTSILLET